MTEHIFNECNQSHHRTQSHDNYKMTTFTLNTYTTQSITPHTVRSLEHIMTTFMEHHSAHAVMVTFLKTKQQEIEDTELSTNTLYNTNQENLIRDIMMMDLHREPSTMDPYREVSMIDEH